MIPRLILAGTIALLLGASGLIAQAPAVVSGRAVDAVTGAGVEGVELSLGDRAVRSGPGGLFRISGVTTGTRRLVGRRIGYLPDTTSVDVLPGTEQVFTVALRPAPIAVAPLAVTALPPGAVTLDAEELRVRGSDLGTALDGWAGISIRRTGGGTAVPQVRGSAPEEVLVLLDGIPLNDPLTGRADLARVSVADVAGVVLLPGVQTARTGGRAIAGVIEVTTRPRVTPELSSSAGSYGAWGSRGGAGIGVLSVSAEVDHLPDDYPATAPGGEPTERENAGGTIWSTLVRGRGALDLTLRANGADRGLPGNMTNPSLTGSGSDRTLLAAIRRAGTVNWSVTGQWVETRSADPDAPPRNTSYDFITRSAGGSGELSGHWPVRLAGWNGEATIAGDGRYDRFTGDGVSAGADFARAGARMGVALAAGPWTLSPVIRMDVWSRAAGAVVTGRLDAGWHRSGTSASIGIGSGITPPVPFDLLFREGVGVALNPDLRPERVRWEGSADLRQTGTWFGVPGTLSLSGFIGRVDDFVTWAAGANFIWSPQNVDIRRKGGELALELRPAARFSLTAGLSASIVDFANAPFYPVAYRPRDSERAGASWTPAGWRFDLGWRRLGKRPQFNDGHFNLPAIGLWDLGAERRLGRTLLLRIDGRDLTDRRPEYVAGLPLPGRTVSLTLTYSVP